MVDKSALVERMPVLDEATYSGRRSGSLPAAVSTSQMAALNHPNRVSKPTTAPLDLLGVDLLPSSPQSGSNQALKSGTDVLLDLLSIGTPPSQSGSSTPDIISSSQDHKTPVGALERLSSPSSLQASSPSGGSPVIDLLDEFTPNLPMPENNGSAYPSVVAFESSSLRIMFNFSKPPGNPQTTHIEANFTNKSPNVYTDFIFQAAVPKFLQLHLDPATGNTLPASDSGSIAQKLRVTNSQHGKKSLVMRIRIAYRMNNKDVLEEGQINNFPRDL
ncbi:unnamed protein product [Ilex paraguariensis]|uniref:GAE domain-containing protein n=1 Tax=Ilex paraguariensis TaxID=185542 RepID=A0ABC8R017_9AQUA